MEYLSADKELIIIGASGHGKVIADIAEKAGYKNIRFLDDDLSIKECAGYSVIGSVKEYKKYQDGDFIIAIGNAVIREKIFLELESAKVNIITLIHPNAIISRRVTIGKGTVIMAGSVINSDTYVGVGCIINTGSSVDHDGRIGNFVHISVGAHLAGTVAVGEKTWIGAGAIILNNLKICSHCMIGAGAVVVKSIDVIGTYIGIPAKIIERDY